MTKNYWWLQIKGKKLKEENYWWSEINAMMEYEKIINLLENTPNQPTKFRTKNWIEINDDSRGTHNTNSQIRFKTSMLRSSLCDYSEAYILVNGTIKISGARNNDAARRLYEGNKRVIFKNCAPFTDCISEINNTQIDNAKYIDVVMPVYNWIEYSDNYFKTSILQRWSNW